ncbi:MAG TPA: YeeE/YedE family protein [Desulfovibrio sp.]|nr:YeeE/YedE family protein [Desulfovibrio sp.]
MLINGLVTGVLFGILLQRAEVLRYDRQLGALRLQDMTIIKFMLSAIIVSMVGIHALVDLEVAKLSVKPLVLGANIGGGLLFGLGWGILGYCPGTAAGALGEGRLDALWGIMGGLAGAAAYAELYPAMKATLLSMGDVGKVTLPQLLGLGHWPVIVIFIVVVVAVMRLVERKGL